MKTYRFQFPHISRFFPAHVFRSLVSWAKLFAAWTAVGLLISINKLTGIQPPVASDTLTDKAVLGAATAPHVLEAQLSYWKKLIEEKPDYRDAYIMAAFLSYQLGEKGQTKEFLQKALTLDPNSSASHKLLKQLEEETK